MIGVTAVIVTALCVIARRATSENFHEGGTTKQDIYSKRCGKYAVYGAQNQYESTVKK